MFAGVSSPSVRKTSSTVEEFFNHHEGGLCVVLICYVRWSFCGLVVLLCLVEVIMWSSARSHNLKRLRGYDVVVVLRNDDTTEE